MSSTTPAPWIRTTKGHPCPLCHRAGCLLSSATEPEAVVCRRKASARPIRTAGWLHELRPSPPWTKWRTSLARLARQDKFQKPKSGR